MVLQKFVTFKITKFYDEESGENYCSKSTFTTSKNVKYFFLYYRKEFSKFFD